METSLAIIQNYCHDLQIQEENITGIKSAAYLYPLTLHAFRLITTRTTDVMCMPSCVYVSNTLLQAFVRERIGRSDIYARKQ